MRYYVVCVTDSSLMRYIAAETVREHTDLGASREVSVASAVAGVRAEILTEDEIASTPEGRSLLRAWNDHDDATFDDDTESLMHPAPHLSLVK